MNKDPNIENLEPFKKGQSGNPNGRPKGSRNRATIVREWLEVQQEINNPITGQKEKLQQQDIITLALIKQAREGNVRAWEALMDSAHGKVVNLHDVNNGDGKNLPEWMNE